MEPITPEELNHCAQLAMLDLAADEQQELMADLNRIARFIGILDHVPLTHEKSTRRGHHRSDQTEVSFSQSQILANCEDHKDGFVLVPKVLHRGSS